MASSDQVFTYFAKQGITLPSRIEPRGLYDLVVVHAGVAHVSGQLPRTDDKNGLLAGLVMTDADIPAARHAAQLCFGRALLALHQTLGDLKYIDRLLSIRGYVRAVPEFQKHGEVIDAASMLARDIFGDAGRHMRSSLGVSSLPGGGLVELEVTAVITTNT